MCMLCTIGTLSAQQGEDEARISIRAVVADGQIPAEAAACLQTKMQQALTANGCADLSCTERFVLTAKATITQKDVVPITPARVSQKIDLTFMVGDVVENKIYESCTVSLNGIGTTDTKAFITAFNKLSPNHKDLQEMLERAKNKIAVFYAGACEDILAKAETLAATGNYDEAIAQLMDVPSVCRECFVKCQSTAVSIYGMKVDAEGTALLQKAQAAWMAEPNASGAVKAASFICGISPQSAAFPAAEKLRKEISDKLLADERQQWDMEMKRYNDSIALKRSAIKACRDIGVAWGNGQPRTITKTIISRW